MITVVFKNYKLTICFLFTMQRYYLFYRYHKIKDSNFMFIGEIHYNPPTNFHKNHIHHQSVVIMTLITNLWQNKDQDWTLFLKTRQVIFHPMQIKEKKALPVIHYLQKQTIFNLSVKESTSARTTKRASATFVTKALRNYAYDCFYFLYNLHYLIFHL